MLLVAPDVALAALRASGELPEDWLAFPADRNTIVCGRVVLPADAALDGQAGPTFAAAITFNCATAAAAVVASGRGLPARCVCDKSSIEERCVCVGGPCAELAAGLARALASKELADLARHDRPQIVLKAWISMLTLVAGAELCHGLRNAHVEKRLADEASWTAASQLELRPRPRYDLTSGARVVCFAAKDNCALLVSGSSVDGQQLRVREARGGEVDAPREGEASSSDDAAPVEDRVVICDACCACKPQLKNAARTVVAMVNTKRDATKAPDEQDFQSARRKGKTNING
jgi:hypothetical protein